MNMLILVNFDVFVQKKPKKLFAVSLLYFNFVDFNSKI